MFIDCNGSAHITKQQFLDSLQWSFVQERKSENAAFEVGILLLQSMAAENTAETVAASSYLPRKPLKRANEFPFIFNGVASLFDSSDVI